MVGARVGVRVGARVGVEFRLARVLVVAGQSALRRAALPAAERSEAVQSACYQQAGRISRRSTCVAATT